MMMMRVRVIETMKVIMLVIWMETARLMVITGITHLCLQVYKEQKQENEDDETATKNNNSSIPPVLHACTKLLALVYSQDDKEKDEQKHKNDEQNKNDLSSSDKEDDISNLRHVPNIVDQISAVFSQIHKMNCMKPQPEILEKQDNEEETKEEDKEESQNQDSWKIVGTQDSSNLDINMEPVYYKEPS